MSLSWSGPVRDYKASMARIYIALAFVAGIGVGFLLGDQPEHPTIARERVPSHLHCTAEEAIQFVDSELQCIHIDLVSDN